MSRAQVGEVQLVRAAPYAAEQHECLLQRSRCILSELMQLFSCCDQICVRIACAACGATVVPDASVVCTLGSSAHHKNSGWIFWGLPVRHPSSQGVWVDKRQAAGAT